MKLLANSPASSLVCSIDRGDSLMAKLEVVAVLTLAAAAAPVPASATENLAPAGDAALERMVRVSAVIAAAAQVVPVA